MEQFLRRPSTCSIVEICHYLCLPKKRLGNRFVPLLKPLAIATTYIEGALYQTAASVIPLSLEKHFQTTKEKDRDETMRRICDVGLKKRIRSFMDVKHDDFDQTYLI